MVPSTLGHGRLLQMQRPFGNNACADRLDDGIHNGVTGIFGGARGLVHRGAQIQRDRNRADGSSFLHPVEFDDITRRGDEASDTHGDVAQHVIAGLDGSLIDGQEVAMKLPVAAGNDLSGQVSGAGGQAEGTELAGGMCPDIARGIEHFDSERR